MYQISLIILPTDLMREFVNYTVQASQQNTSQKTL